MEQVIAKYNLKPDLDRMRKEAADKAAGKMKKSMHDYINMREDRDGMYRENYFERTVVSKDFPDAESNLCDLVEMIKGFTYIYENDENIKKAIKVSPPVYHVRSHDRAQMMYSYYTPRQDFAQLVREELKYSIRSFVEQKTGASLDGILHHLDRSIVLVIDEVISLKTLVDMTIYDSTRGSICKVKK